MSKPDLLTRLLSEFGDSVTLRGPVSADTLDGIQPEAVAAPRDESAARSIVAYCGREGLAMIPRGGGTKWTCGAPPRRFDVLLSTEHLHEVFEHDEGNATARVGAGITLQALSAALANRRQFAPLQSSKAAATLGGAVASNRSGPCRLKYGTPRDLVVGMSAVLSDGRLVQAGSKVVKNVSGYDLCKLFVGSHGGLGVITSVTVRLRPFEESHARWSRDFATWQGAQELAMCVLDGPFEPTSLSVHATGGSFSTSVAFDGVAAAVDAQLARMPGEGDAGAITPPASGVEPVVKVEATVLLREAAGWARLALQEGARHVEWECGSGTVCAEFDRVPELAKLRHASTAANGFLVVTLAPTDMKTPELVWGAVESKQLLQAGLKIKFDAAAVFSPGRGCGGL